MQENQGTDDTLKRGGNPDYLRARLARDAARLGSHGGDRASEEYRTGKEEQGGITTLIRNTVPYFRARLERDAARLGCHGGDRKSAAFQDREENQDSNGILIRGGNNTPYLHARLQRDAANRSALKDI